MTIRQSMPFMPSRGLAGKHDSREGAANRQAFHRTNRSFVSDNTAGASPEVLEAVAACSGGPSVPYGADDLTHLLTRKFCNIFERELDVFLVPTGTAANALCLSAMTPPWGSVLCHAESHINTDECGAVEFYTGGAKLLSVDCSSTKLDPAALGAAVARRRGDIHSTQPACASITQATEHGEIYQCAEIEALGAVCQAAAIRFHMDGARFANAVASTGCSPAQLSWKAGVDALSFGATKNGTLGIDAIVLFDKGIAEEMAYRRKRSGHLLSKARFASAQMIAYLENDLWLRNACRANAMALRLAEGLRGFRGIEQVAHVEANIVFFRLPNLIAEGLREAGFCFHDGRWEAGVSRFVTSFQTSEEDVDALIAEVTLLADNP